MRNGSTGTRARGFTLLEVFIATAILGISIIFMFDALTHSPDRANRAKLTSVATMLARAKLIDVEADLLRDGWEEFDDEECGDFTDDEYGGVSRYKWCVRIEKIELPDSVDVQGIVSRMLGVDSDDPDAADQSNGTSGVGSNLLGLWMGGMGGIQGLPGMSGSSSSSSGISQPTDASQSPIASLLASFLAPFRNVVEQAIRRILVRVYWTYRGKEESVTLLYYLTRPELVEQAIIGGYLEAMQQGASSGQQGGGGKGK